MAPSIDQEETVESRTPNSHLKPRRTEKDADPSHSLLLETPSNELHDLICVGFGPASLAIAVALQDALECKKYGLLQPKVCFLERQEEFRWHAGMLLPDTKMQISWMKDLATLRNPRSHFTFLNYLKNHDRLVQFANLGTFLPSRVEFADYMTWCSAHFTKAVRYGQEVVKITPEKSSREDGKIDALAVQSRDVTTGELTTRRAHHLIIAVGGRPYIPTSFLKDDTRIIHSSGYGNEISDILKHREGRYNVAVVGSGQSAAEVFNDLHTRFPNARTALIIRDTALRPSDDSPFVNEIFNPERVNSFFEKSPNSRELAIRADKGTNYGVVRPELLEKIYYTLYEQRIGQSEEILWKHKIYPSCEVVEVVEVPQNRGLSLVLKRSDHASSRSKTETLNVDAVVVATGYVRDAHVDMLKDCKIMSAGGEGKWEVGRNYKLRMSSRLVEEGMGIWLQGCNQDTHGLADSLLSVLATRGGEIVESIFGMKASNGTL